MTKSVALVFSPHESVYGCALMSRSYSFIYFNSYRL